jgi:hypothetical protein
MRNQSPNAYRWTSLAAVLLLALAAAGCAPPIAASSSASGELPTSSNAADDGSVATLTTTADESTTQDATPTTSSPADSTPAASEPAKPPPVNRPPRADRSPVRQGDAEKITFDDLNLQMLPNIVFREFMVNDRVKELEGRRVSISGFMHGGAAGSSGIKRFVLLKNTECKFGKDGQADHLAMVYLKSGNSADYTPSDVKVEGTLKIEPFTGTDGNTWSIYNLEDAQIR